MQAEQSTNIDVYLDEYTRDDIIARYIAKTAGAGIDYVLSNVYAPIYQKIIKQLRASKADANFRILEYGCGGGMNLLKMIEVIQANGGVVENAFGTDFSPPMVQAARKELSRLPSSISSKITYAVAGNETLARDLAANTASAPKHLLGTFDMVFGVNTFRYCHRLKKENDCARDIFNLLRPGGYSIMIDMNRHFPLFRSKLRDMLTRPKHEYYIPSLKEYARPFRETGFEVSETRNFCWIPHSARPVLLKFCRTLTPVLDTCCPMFAMRSLVIARRPN